MTNTGQTESSYLICTQSAFTMSAMILSAMAVMGVFFSYYVKSVDTVNEIPQYLSKFQQL